MAVPSITVEAPVAVPAKFNLLDTFAPMPLPAHGGFGVDVENLYCGLAARTWYSACGLPVDPEDVEDKVVDDGRTWELFEPVTVYHQFRCRTVGSWDMGEEFARRALDLGASYALEQYLASLVAAAADTTTVADTAGLDKDAIVATIALMEQQWASTVSGSMPVLHMGRDAATLAYDSGVIERNDGRLETGLGTPVVAGAGYGGAIFMTGHVAVYMDDITVSDKSLAMPFNNEFVALAERLYVPTYQCGALYSAITA